MSTVDTNVDNYTIDELIAILELEDPTEEEIVDTSNGYIEKYEDEGNETMATFFQDIQNKLVQYMDALENGDDPEEYDPDAV